MWEKIHIFSYLMVYLGNIFFNYGGFYFKTKKLIFNTWKPRLQWLTGRCNLSCAQKQPPTSNKLNSIRAACQLLWKMHELIHTYFLQKRNSWPTENIYKNIHEAACWSNYSFSFPSRGYLEKKKKTTIIFIYGIIFISSSILNCEPVNTLNNIFEMSN